MINEILTGTLVIITAAYAYLTYRMAVVSEKTLSLMLEQTDSLTRPFVVIQPYVRPNTPFIYIKIKNTGKSSAEKLSLSLDKDFFRFDNKNENLRDFDAFNEVIDSLAPDQEVHFALGQAWLIYGKSENPMPKQFSIKAEYKSKSKTIIENNNIDLRTFEQSEAVKDPLIEEIKGIREAVSKK